MFTIGCQAHGGALVPLRMCGVQAGVAAFVLDGNGLDGELAVGQGGAEPHSALVRRLDHGVAALCVGSHLRDHSLGGRVLPCDLLHLLGQTVGAGEGGLLAAHRCLVALDGDLCWERRRPVHAGKDD